MVDPSRSGFGLAFIRGSRTIRVPLLVSVSVLLVLAFTLAFAGAQTQPPPAEDRTPEPEAFGKIYHCKPGPWGALEYYHVHLEIPDWMIDSVSRPGLVPTWHFPGATKDSLRDLFQKAGLSSALQDYLLDPAHQSVQDGMISVLPPVPDLIAMQPEQRAVIYDELSKSEINASHARPAFITNGDPDSWFQDSGLRAELLDTIKKLLWTQGEILCFSDHSVLLGMARTKEEVRDIVRVINRTSALVLRISLKDTPDFAQTIQYWTADGRNRNIEPMLRSAAETEGGDLLDATHLLPPIPRSHLYSFYSGEVPIVGSLPNCHWTSLNFFNTVALDYHRDPRLATLHANEDYATVPAPYRFGDVIFFVTRAGIPLHSCVYIADDIVYTKNGQSAAVPWVLMKLGDVQRIYTRNQPLTIQGYRLKPKPAMEQVASGG